MSKVSVRSLAGAAVALGAMLAAVPAGAQETTTYTYDAKGRVVKVEKSGGPINGTNTTYAYDKADNRTNVTVANSPNGNASSTGGGASASTALYVVVPLNGYTLIQISK